MEGSSYPKAALITGGAKRIGRAICWKLHEMGYAIALHYHRSINNAKTLADEIRAEGGKCQLFRADLSHQRDIQGLIPAAKKKYPGLEVLVNNASIFERSTLRGMPLRTLERDFRINLFAPLLLMRDFAKHCPGGQIINILDTRITQNASDYLAYHLSKKALFEATKSAAMELAPKIRVNGVAPGFILPPVHVRSTNSKRLLKKIPLGVQGESAHVSAAAAFFITHPYVTGEVIFVDGGEHLR